MAKGRILLIAGAVTSLFFINFCNLVYGCGCTWLWAGADAHCNVHAAHGRHCPWCLHGAASGVGVWAAMVLAQAGVVYAKTGWGWPVRLGLALLTFPVVGGILALVLGLYTGYWD